MQQLTRSVVIGLTALSLFGCSLHKWAPLNRGTGGSGGTEESGGAGGSGGEEDGGTGGTTSEGGSTGEAGASSSDTTTCTAGYALVGSDCIALLSSLTVGGGTLSTAFDPSVAAYATTVNADTTTVAATTEIDGAVITIAGAESVEETVTLADPVTTVTVTVSYGETSATYTLAIARFGAQQAYIKATNTGESDRFGSSIDISSDGNTLAIGAPNEDSATSADQASAAAQDSGAVYVFTRVDNTWQWLAYLKALTPESGAIFGHAVALSSDGNTLAVSASNESNTVGGTTYSLAGAAYVFTRTAGGWGAAVRITAPNPGLGDQFGTQIDLSADGLTLAIGTLGDDSCQTGVHNALPTHEDGCANSGAAYVFSLTASGWSQQAYLKAPNSGAGKWFGVSVAISDDGNTVVVGSEQETGDSTTVVNAPSTISVTEVTGSSFPGAAYVYSRIGFTWSWSAYLKAPNATSHLLGLSEAMSGDGSTIALAAIDNDQAVAHVYTLGTGGWIYSNTVSTGQSTLAGGALALSSDGTRLALGEIRDSFVTSTNQTLTFAGGLYLFNLGGGTWTPVAHGYASNPGDNDRFGTAVALSGDGHTLATGAFYEDSAGTGVNSEYQADNSATDAGAAYVFLF